MGNIRRLKHLFLFLAGLACCISGIGQNASCIRVEGDTYSMDMPAGWELCTSEQMSGKPMRRNIAGYETTCMTRICPNHSQGVSVSVLEFKGCKDYREIQRRDSLLFASHTDFYKTAVWSKPGTAMTRQSVVLTCSPVKHSETGDNIYMKMKKWYVQGQGNVYLIDFVSSSTVGWDKWLPEMERLLLSFHLTDGNIKMGNK